MKNLNFLKKCRKEIAKYSLLLSVVLVPICCLLMVAAVMACLSGCSSRVSPWELVIITLFFVGCCSVVVSVMNFLYRFFSGGWSQLIIWERFVLYLAFLVALSPLIVHLYFWGI